ncbi:DivIVA domain-containing protein [Streptomyces sp. TRM 70351]|nr:DivIVA domain-containing protein [Streptomyces sp. TRM 70351]MEE1927726.1 DivIVA domain-containing protein [Streptomyces sp. TRM 70351]
MFWFLLLALLVVVGALVLAVVGSDDGTGRARGGLSDPVPVQAAVPLPPERPVGRADVAALRLPLALRGYRMSEVDDALDRLAAELAERDARIAELEAALAGAQATALGRTDLLPGAAHHGRPAAGAVEASEPAGHPEAAGQSGQSGQPDQEEEQR